MEGDAPPLFLRIRVGPIAALALLCAAGAAGAQQPTVSPSAERVLQRDSVAPFWLFAQPQYALEEVAAAVTQAGGAVRHQSRWFHAISANLTRSALRQLRTSVLLTHIQPVARFRGPVLPPPAPLPPPQLAPGAPGETRQYGNSAMPFRRLNLFKLADSGLAGGPYRGTGVKIAMLDTGFETGHFAFSGAKVIADSDFVSNDGVVSNQPPDTASNASRHGTATWSLLAANVPGVLLGVAPDAEYILAKTEDVRSETTVEEDNWVAAIAWAAALGAKVVSSSLGYLTFDGGTGYSFSQLNGDFAITTKAADIAAQLGMTVVVANGNGGPDPRTLDTPADGDSAIAVGAEDSLGTLATFSSRGPTADGRIKPDVTAPGLAVWVVDTDSHCPAGYCRLDGTSFATPLIAGAAALIRQIHPQLSGVEVRDALRYAGNNASQPNNDRGWGLPDVLAAATFPYGIVLASPGTDSILPSITPAFSWSTPGVPPFGLPVTYRLTISRTDTVPSLLDTTLQGTQATLRQPQRPGTRLRLVLKATGADTAVLTLAPVRAYTVPAWADLLTLDEPAGATVREPRPRLRWSAPAVLSPPGPFTFDVEIFRTDTREVVFRALGLDTMSYTPPADLELNTPYRWRVKSHLASDTATTESQGAFVVVDGSIPPVTLLFQNFPNPFPNPAIGLSATCFWFDLATTGTVRLEILDLRGHLVRKLIPPAFTDPLPAGRYGRPGPAGGGRCDPALEWDGRAEDGAFVPRGIYLAKLVTPDGTFFKRIVFRGGQP